MKPASLQTALLVLATLGIGLCYFTLAGAVVASVAIAGLVTHDALRARAEWAAIDKLAKDSAAALIKLEARQSTLERGVKLLVDQ